MDYMNLIVSLSQMLVGVMAGAGAVWKLMVPKIKEQNREDSADMRKTIEENTDAIVELKRNVQRDYERAIAFNERDKKFIKALLLVMRADIPDESGEIAKLRNEFVNSIVDEL